MVWIAGADLAAAVSNAGALGTIGMNAGATTVTDDVNLTGERLRAQIRRAKELTNKPFAVNIAGPASFGLFPAVAGSLVGDISDTSPQKSWISAVLWRLARLAPRLTAYAYGRELRVVCRTDLPYSRTMTEPNTRREAK